MSPKLHCQHICRCSALLQFQHLDRLQTLCSPASWLAQEHQLCRMISRLAAPLHELSCCPHVLHMHYRMRVMIEEGSGAQSDCHQPAL